MRYRLRLLHVSAHLGDGRCDRSENAWIDGSEPIYYSRNYGQFTADVSLPGDVRAYGELSYVAFHSPMGRPLSPWFFSGGFEYRWPRPALLKPFAAIDVRTFDAGPAAGGKLGVQAVAGFRLGSWQQNGLDVVVSHYRGPSWRGQFFDRPVNEWYFGFMLDVH